MLPPILPTSKITISPSPLTPSSFHPFGTAISSPLPATLTRAPPASSLPSLPNTSSRSGPSSLPTPILANQSTALKYSPISVFQNNYDQCKGAEGHGKGRGKDGEPRMSMFSCFPRELKRGGGQRRKSSSGLFDVRILERHPYTTQTFIPLGIPAPVDRKQHDRGINALSTGPRINHDNGGDDDGNNNPTPSYLVIVAPSLHGQTAQAMTVNSQGRKEQVLIRDPPDLRNMKAFIAHGGQGVTYGAGTWHAPMVVVGTRRVDFVVVQFVNGVAEDDCQEVEFGEGLVVDVDVDVDVRETEEYEDEVAKL
ncbi:ureidoglycolate hydrolase [[Emmonsia] crescens]|uniref:Ureidoglycolate hydrolase n=1 Tax=[Emmonsia] crescens TaxID=73230 RepID=A0A0G2I8U3_9EURO|nr:ureidoglycolate hydrolase [Emmonsia crescens UAMH 3008]